jgi:endonuclease YncB( thermonuclease family)
MKAIIASLVFAALCGAAGAEPIQSGDVRVLDGDTIRVFGRQPDVRLVGLNAPETIRAECDAERRLGDIATRRLRAIVRAGSLDLTLVACACLPGTAGTFQCNYGRKCGVLTSFGKDVSALLITEGLAVPFVCAGVRCPPTPRPWCQ